MRNKISSLGTAALAIMLIVVAGCQTTSAPKDERSAGRALDDKNITSRVTKSLKNEPSYKFTTVGVNTFAGIVELSGFVNSEEQKTRAEEIARNTEGVKDVANGITLKPLMVVEPTGRTNSSARIYSDPQEPVSR